MTQTSNAKTPIKERYILTLSCPNRPGIVAAVSGLIFEVGFNIFDAHQFDDVETGRFFMRVGFNPVKEGAIEAFMSRFPAIKAQFGMETVLRSADQPQRIMIMASQSDHCLSDLLYRHRIGELPITISAIVANHPRETYAHLDFGDSPFHYLPVTTATKRDQEQALLKLVDNTRTDLVVLARYMQILSDELSASLSGRCINIHHSFLPGFKGAKPYHQAHRRGVKLIGATAHYVTADLDEGPIIEQDVERISHSDTPEHRAACSCPRRALACAGTDHAQREQNGGFPSLRTPVGTIGKIKPQNARTQRAFYIEATPVFNLNTGDPRTQFA